MTIITPSGDELLAQATANLSRFVHAQARASEELIGFGWKLSSDAPSEFTALRRAFIRSRLTGQPLPVSDAHSAETIFGPSANYAFRFWHDVTHVRLNCGFDLDGEIEVATAHLDVLQAFGWGPGTLEHHLLHADTLGQVLCSVATGTFPDDQVCFARRVVTTSITEAIRAELDGHSILNGFSAR
jgi:hypothetical protein